MKGDVIVHFLEKFKMGLDQGFVKEKTCKKRARLTRSGSKKG